MHFDNFQRRHRFVVISTFLCCFVAFNHFIFTINYLEFKQLFQLTGILGWDVFTFTHRFGKPEITEVFIHDKVNCGEIDKNTIKVKRNFLQLECLYLSH